MIELSKIDQRSTILVPGRRLLALGLVCIVVASHGLLAADADRFAKVKITSEPVAGSVHMLQGAGGNIAASIGADGTLIVDDQFAPLAERIQACLLYTSPSPRDQRGSRMPSSA